MSRSRTARPRPAATPPTPRAPRPAGDAPSPLASLAVGLVALAAYVVLAPARPADKDSGEFTLVLATLGLAHPTGYPLYTLVGHPFVVALHVLGVSWAKAANTFSALGAALALALMHALAARALATRLSSRTAALVALLPVAAFGADPIWLAEATLAEVNSWHAAWAAGAALAALACGRALETPRASKPTPLAAFGAGALVGAGLGHHATSLFVAAPLVLAMLPALARHPRRGALTLAAVAGVLATLPVLAYVPYRAWHPAAVQWPLLQPAWSSVLDHLTGAQYRGFFGHFAPSPGEARLLTRWAYPWLVPGTIAALALPFVPLAMPRATRIGIAVAVVASGLWCFAYGVPDPGSYFLVPLMLGLACVPAVLASFAPVRGAARVLVPAAAVLVITAAIPGVRFMLHRDAVSERADRLLRDMWHAVPARPGFLVWEDDMISRLQILQRLEGEHPELTLVRPAHLSYPGPRRAFVERWGFDPLAGLDSLLVSPVQGDTARVARLVDGIAENINRQQALPVYLFMPQVPSVRLLRKPDATPAPAVGAHTP